jgi:N-acetylneuraminic acid mutarotase
MKKGSATPEWYYSKAGTRSAPHAGPFSLEQLRSLAQSGAILPADLIWNPGVSLWLPAGQIAALFPEEVLAGAESLLSDKAEPGKAATATGRSWLAWVIPLATVIIVGGGLGIYFGLFRDAGESTGDDRTTTTLAATTAVSETTTTTEATAAWIDLKPSGSLPAARWGHSLVFDSRTGKTILFGGWGAEARIDLNDTWAYDPASNTWTDLKPAGAVPPARDHCSMVFDGLHGKAILFGGYVDASGAYLNDTWAYDPAANTWTNLNPAGEVPLARAWHPMVYDPGAGKVILFGGCANDSGADFDDTWAYDPTANTWTNLKPAGAVPSARDAHAMAYASDSGKVILFGGWDNKADVYRKDTWAYDSAANTWTDLKPAGAVPFARSLHSMVYSPAVGRLILFGGWDYFNDFNDTWTYDVNTNTWTDLQPPGAIPLARDGHAMVFDSLTSKVVLFGGDPEDGTSFDDTWAYASPAD